MKETIKQKIRKVFRFLQVKTTGNDEYGNNGYIVLSGKKYAVGKMSYDEWYLEPWKKGRNEIDQFHKDTLWEKFDTTELLQLFEDNGLIELKIM